MKKLFNEKKGKVSENISKKLASKPFLLNGMFKKRKGQLLMVCIVFIAIVLLLEWISKH